MDFKREFQNLGEGLGLGPSAHDPLALRGLAGFKRARGAASLTLAT